MAGRLLLVWRLLVRDLRRRRTETALLVVATAAAAAALTLGLTLQEMVADPYGQTRLATAGPDLVAEPGVTGPEALRALEPLPSAPGVTGHSGPFPVAYTAMTYRGAKVNTI